MRYEFHPAAEMFPLLEESKLAELAADIEANGLLHPITLYKGQILDGRNRYLACRRAGVQPTFTEYDGDTPVAHAWSLNSVRRQLTSSQLAAVAARMAPALREEAMQRKKATTFKKSQVTDSAVRLHGDGPQNQEVTCGDALSIAANQVGVSRAVAYRAAAVQRDRPDLFAEVEAGNMSVGRAYRETVQKPPARVERKARAERVAEILALAASGHVAEQIAEQIGISAGTVRVIATKEGIALPDHVIGKTRRIDARRVIEETANALAGCAMGVQTIERVTLNVSSDDAAQWARSIARSMKSMNKLLRRLKEASNG